MASKMKRKDIDEYIKSKSVTQDTYIAPTVQTHVDNRAPAIVQATQTVKKEKPKVNILKTAANIATNMGTSAIKNLEGVADTASDLIFNPIEQGINYAVDYATKGKKTALENYKDLKKMQERDIKKNRTEKFLKDVGYSDIVDKLEEGSLVRRDNFGGKVAQGVGGMVPALVVGGALGSEAALTDVSKLTGKEKALAALGNVGKTYVSQLPANAVLGASSYGSGMEEALNDGATMGQARKFGLANAAIEQGTEMITGGVPGLGGKGGLDGFVDPLIDKGSKGFTKAALKTLYRAGGEGLEESAAALLNPIAKKIYSDEKINWKEVGKQALEEGLVGAATGAVLGGSQTVADFQNARVEKMNRVQNLNDVQRNALIEVTNKRKQGIPLDQNDYAVIGAINNTVNNMVDAQRGQNFEDNLQLQPQQTQENRFTYEPSDNAKIDNFRQSASQFMNNSETVQSLANNIEKVINDKNYNITFDDTIGDGINGRIGINENGEVEIKINPNSDRAGEFVLTHEITHAIETKDMRDLVMDYASKNSEFERALKSLQEKYGTTDVSDEVLADISGNLFGDEAFITNLSTTKPNIFKRFYNTIMSLANKITGNSNEALFIKDLKNKWEKAYREADTNTAIENLNGETKLDLSKDALKEVSDAINETQQQAINNHNQFLKLKDNTIKSLVDYGVSDLPMMANRSHVRENILTSTEAENLGYSTKNKHFHGLGVKTYLEIIDSMDNPIGVYQYTDKGKYDSNNFIVLTPIEINGKKAIVPVEINKKGQYNQVEIDYNKIKTSYAKDNDNYINNLLKKGKIKEIFAGSNSQKTSLTDNNISQGNKNVKYSISKKTGKLQDANGKDVKLDTSTTGTTGTLMAIHNLNENKLKGILELGGFPVPSIAVTNPNIVNHKQFGDISVLFDKSTIDPAIEANEVYDRDVWSPTFPQIDYELNDKGIDKVAKDLGIEDWKMRDYAEDNKREYLVERLIRDEDIVNKYVEDNSINYETAYKDAETRVDMHQSSKGLRKFIVDNDLTVNKLVKNPKLRQKYFDAIKEYYDNSSFPEQVKENLYNEKINFLNNGIENQKGAGDNFIVRELKRYQDDFDLIKSGENQVVDEYKTNQNKKEAAIKNGIEKYLDNEIDSIYGEKGIRNDKEYLTPSGQRRSFWQLHDEYNLENIVDALTSRDTKGTQDWIAGYGQIQAQMGKRFNSIADIKSSESQLTNLSETNDALEDARSAIESDMDEIAARNESDYTIISELLADFAKGDLTVDNFKDLTRNYYQTTQNVPDSLINKIIDDLNNLKNLPTDYFEAKPQRAVGLDEVQAIVIPNNMDSSFKKQLQDQGLTYYEYDPNIEGDRNRVINQFDDLKFSKQNDEWYDYLDKNFRSKGNKTPLRDLKMPMAEVGKETKTTQSKAKISGTDEISAKKADSVITVRNSKGQELKLKQDKTNPNIYEKEIKVPKDNKSIVPKETMQKQLAKLKDGTKVSNFYSNLTENSKFITQENANKLSQEEIWRYAPQTNKETMANAEARIGDTQKSLETAYGDFLSKSENFSPEDVGVGWILLKRFQDAGNYDAMVQVAKKMRNIATKSGQTVQMFNLQSRLTPEGMVKYAQSELMEAEQQFNKGKSQKEIDKYAKDFELTGEEVEFIKNQMEKIQSMEDGRAKNIEMAKINKMLSDKLPHKRGDSIKAWMRMSMLFNPKTQVRNVVGNALITPINAIADVPASIADKAISRKTGTRTIGAPSLGGLATYGKGFARGGVEAWQDYRTGLDTKDVDMSRFDITQKSPFVTDHKGAASVLNPVSKGLNKANAFLDLVMSGGDRVFYQGAFDASLRNQMQLNNVDTPTQDMIDIATQEALSRTWNDNNGYTQFVLNTRRALNKASIGGYGLGDVLIPFAKTPANLTKAIYDYSPVGLTSTLFKTKSIQNAIETGQITSQMQHDFAQNLGKGVAGTMLYAMAYALAKSGIATGSGDDDKDVANFIKNTMGIQPYSIKIGDKSFTYDWAQPVAAPLAIATDAYKNLTNKSEEDTMTRVFNTILDVSNTGFNVLMQQSFLQGISEVLNSNEGVANGIMEQVIGLPARAVPTFVQQINNMFDKTQRVAFEKNQPLKTGKQNVMSKLPGQSEKLAPRVDALGNEVQRYGDSKSEITYALKNFLSPANQSNRQTSKAAEEIYKVYEATGDKTIMPMVAPYYIQNKTVGRIDLDSKDRATYQKISGKLVNDAVIELTNDSDYKNLSYDEKAEVLNGIVSYSNAKAKEHFTGFMANTYNPANKKINNGMSIADYYLEKTMNKR